MPSDVDNGHTGVFENAGYQGAFCQILESAYGEGPCLPAARMLAIADFIEDPDGRTATKASRSGGGRPKTGRRSAGGALSG